MSETWTKSQVKTLKRLMSDGLSFSQIAGRIGVTRSAAIAKSHRLKDHIFPSDRRRGHRTKAETAAHRKAEKLLAAAALNAMKERLARGFRRDSAIRIAWDSGAPQHMVAAQLGLTAARISQICGGVK